MSVSLLQLSNRHESFADVSSTRRRDLERFVGVLKRCIFRMLLSILSFSRFCLARIDGKWSKNMPVLITGMKSKCKKSESKIKKETTEYPQTLPIYSLLPLPLHKKPLRSPTRRVAQIQVIHSHQSSGSGSTESTTSEMKTFINPGTSRSASSIARRNLRIAFRA